LLEQLALNITVGTFKKINLMTINLKKKYGTYLRGEHVADAINRTI
jgi:hypothetical protein